jgi:uncharacterized protein YlxP (DUF503 family)
MNIALMQVEFFLADSHSLKEKRMILKSLKDRIHNSFNVSVAEINDCEKWQRATLAFSTIGNSRKYLDKSLGHLVEFLRKQRSLEIIDYQTEFL